MKLKKILSLLSALTVSVSCFASLATTASATTGTVDAPEWVIDAHEITEAEWAQEPYKNYTNYKNASYKTYWINLTLKGIELQSQTNPGMMGMTTWTGHTLAAINAHLAITGGTYGQTFMGETAKGLTLLDPDTSKKQLGDAYVLSSLATTTGFSYPKSGDATHTRDKETPILASYIIMMDANTPLTIDVMKSYGEGSNLITTSVETQYYEADVKKLGTGLKFENIASTPKTIPAPATVAVTGVELNETALNLTVGDEETLTATVAPTEATNKNVSWSSSKPEVATVVDGVVTAVAPGEATITVTTEDGSKTDTCTVKVSAATTPVTGVTLNETELTLTEGDEETLTATVAPTEATNKNVSWSSDDTDVATVVNGVVKAVAEGTTTITVTTEDGSKTATCTVKVEPAGLKITMPDNVTTNNKRYYHEKDKGYVWNIIVSNYLKNEVLSATFTSPSAAEPKVQKLPIGGLADGEGSFSFDIILRTPKNDVTLNVAEVK